MNSLIILYKALDGYKSYIIAGAIALAVLARILNAITQDQFEAVLAFLGAGGIVAIKSAVEKVEVKQDALSQEVSAVVQQD